MAHGSHIIHHSHKKQRAIEAAAEIEGMSNAEVKAAVFHPTNRFKRLIDKLVYFTGTLSILMAIPQAIMIHTSYDASGVSFPTWFTFMINAVIWTTYGIIHKERPIIMMYVCYFIIDLFIVAGILMYS